MINERDMHLSIFAHKVSPRVDEKGTVVELTANPNSGYLFDHWEGDVTGNDNPVTLIMDATRDVTAVFVEDPFTNELEIDDFQDYTNNGPPGVMSLS